MNIVKVSDFSMARNVPSIIVSDLNIEGDLISQGAVEIGGKLKGNIKCSHVTIRKGGHIDGNIYADNLIINGYVDGKVVARNVSINRDGHIKGTIEYGHMSIESGAAVECRCKKTAFKDEAKEEIQEIPQIGQFLSDSNSEEVEAKVIEVDVKKASKSRKRSKKSAKKS